MEEIKRYTIEACRDYSDCWLDVSEAIEQDYLTEELYCKDADVQGLEKQISDHKAVVETMKQDHENKIYHKDTEVNLAHGECEQLRLKVSEMQNKIDELENQKPVSNLGLSKEEVKFVKTVFTYPGCKLDSGQAFHFYDDGSEYGDQIALWEKPEELGIIKCVGSYKWVPVGLKMDLFVANGDSKGD